jgi:hypothetical protein
LHHRRMNPSLLREIVVVRVNRLLALALGKMSKLSFVAIPTEKWSRFVGQSFRFYK